MKSSCKYLVLCLLALVSIEVTVARVPVSAVAPLLETAAGRQWMSRFTGQSIKHIAQMGTADRQRALVEALKGHEELSSEISRISQEISRASDREAVAKSLLSRGTLSQWQPQVRQVSLRKGVMGRVQAQGSQVVGQLERAFQARSDISERVVQKIVQAGRSFKRKTGSELFGRDALRCVQTFEARLVENLSGVVGRVSGSRGLTTVKEGFDSLVRGAQETFQVAPAEAKRRVCGLGGSGKSTCSIFSSRVVSVGNC